MPILFSCSASLCDKLCVLEVVSSESVDWNCVGEKKITSWHCLPIVASIPLLQETIREPTDGDWTVQLWLLFFCTVIKSLCFVDISFSFRALGNPSRKKIPQKVLTLDTKADMYKFTVYTHPQGKDQWVWASVIPLKFHLWSPGVKWGRDLLNNSSRRTRSYSPCFGPKRKLLPGRSQTQPDILLSKMAIHMKGHKLLKHNIRLDHFGQLTETFWISVQSKNVGLPVVVPLIACWADIMLNSIFSHACSMFQ